MIHTDFNWTEPANALLLLAAAALLIIQCRMLYTQRRQSGGRQSGGRQSKRWNIRLALNVLLWTSVLAWIADPYFKSGASPKTGLLVAGNVPSEVAAHFRDSLAGAEVISVAEIASKPVDTLVIVGQEFDENAIASISQLKNMPSLQWLPYFKPDELRHLHWRGVVRKGEMQRVEGTIQLSAQKTLQVRYAGLTLDSITLDAGVRHFTLSFPAFSEGRTTTTLALDGQTVDTLRFFTRPEGKLTVRFLLDNPDFETRNLATWLGKQGHAVLYGATLSRNIRSELNINRAADPDLIITSASNAAAMAVRKAVNGGKSVLFLSLNDPATDLRSINRALGTGFQPVKISNDESVPVSPGLTARPFRFARSDFQMQAPHYPVQMEKTSGKIAVSLLNETFPMQLAGDSVAYGRVWDEILAYVRPAQVPVLAWDAPVFENVPLDIHMNTLQPVPRFLTLGQDTVSTVVSALNGRSATATLLPHKNGWLALHDSLQTELYVQDYSALRYASRMQHFIHYPKETNASTGERDLPARKLPGWAWFTWLVLCLAALWIEPKL